MRTPTIATLAAALLICPAAVAQPANDNCDAPEAISGYGTFAFDVTTATQDGIGNALCNAFGNNQIGRDTWYCWTAPASGPVLLQTCAQTTIDTKIGVYNGCSPCPEAGGILACNDDACSLQTRVAWLATAGQTYLLRVGTYPPAASGGVGTFTIGSALPGILAGPFLNAANGSTYYLLEASNWDFAQAKAVDLGGDLATVRNLEENEFIRAQVLGFDGADRRGWLGLNDAAQEGVFVWVSGESNPFTNWSSGEPNNNPAPENYVEMFGSNGLWNDANQNAASPIRYGVVEVGEQCRPDWNHDDVVNSSDISAFLTAWLDSVVNGNLIADYDTNGLVNSSDVSAFLTAWLQAVQQGC